MGKSDAWHKINNRLFSAENADGCRSALQSFPVPEIAEGISLTGFLLAENWMALEVQGDAAPDSWGQL